MTRNWIKRRLVWAVLLAGAWLPATITCDPGNFDVYVDGWHEVDDDCWDCGDDHSFYFDFWHVDDD